MTAEEFLKKYNIESYDEGGYLGIDEKEASKMMIEFAKMHVKEALINAANECPMHCTESVMNCYPLDNIK